jgi:N-acetylmuramoyl-L-alanine amidase
MVLAFLFSALVLSGSTPPTICIDPGHPSEVGAGCRGKKLTEVQVNWSVACVLKTELTRAGYRVVLTKKSQNEKRTNRQRAETANKANASLILRLHCDAGAKGGFGTYYPAGQGKAHGVTGPTWDVIKASSALAPIFHRAVLKNLSGWGDRGCSNELRTSIGSKQGALTGSIFSKVPVLLVEMCVLTNAKDEAKMLAPGGYKKMARALKAGVSAVVPIIKP